MFSEGEEVLAKLPNTSEYYKGRILNVKGDQYKIKFETGAQHTVSEMDIKVERRGRTPTRISNRIAGKSPMRQRYSPSRKSPNNINNHKTESDMKKIDESPTETMPLQQRLDEIRTTLMRRARMSSVTKIEKERTPIVLVRDIDRAASLPIERKSYLFDYSLAERGRGYSMQRDKDLTKVPLPQESREEKRVTSIPVNRDKGIIRIDQPQEWGGWIGTSFLIFLLPISIILPQFLCWKGLLLACVSVVPIGKNVDGQQSKIGKLQYRINGFVSATLAVVLFGLCVYKNVPISDYILENSLQLAISGWLIGTILALGLYVKAERASIANLNIYASTNSKIYNFWQGKEINPRIGILDVKLLLIRASLIGTLIMNIAIATKAIGNVRTLNIEQLDVSTLLVISLQLFYILDGLIYEATIFTSFAVMYEGTGYMTCVSHLLYPFLPTLTTKFMLYHKLQFNYYMGIFVLIFIMGYMLYRSSNSRKDEFRKNPVSPTVPYLETIPTSRGKKLMLSGLWGYVRHPNYLGDIMMQWSIAGISLAIDLLPYYAAICCTLTLAYRAVRDNRRCQTRYGYAWEEYCSRVKYMILKCVF
ncbi:Lamin-B receptor [Harpegnathos saltator]|uniref:Lamin-B receptor n=1 Tax=Harpegnathos saltator TaxID=610380 RepID=E2BUR6_HARSA|nr:Lamin-B receptor [Harpegnathos saltator]